MLKDNRSFYSFLFNQDGSTPLMYAVFGGHREMIALVLDHGADVNAKDEVIQNSQFTITQKY
jgi:ankyrin repeat protein